MLNNRNYINSSAMECNSRSCYPASTGGTRYLWASWLLGIFCECPRSVQARRHAWPQCIGVVWGCRRDAALRHRCCDMDRAWERMVEGAATRVMCAGQARREHLCALLSPPPGASDAVLRRIFSYCTPRPLSLYPRSFPPPRRAGSIAYIGLATGVISVGRRFEDAAKIRFGACISAGGGNTFASGSVLAGGQGVAGGANPVFVGGGAGGPQIQTVYVSQQPGSGYPAGHFAMYGPAGAIAVPQGGGQRAPQVMQAGGTTIIMA